MASDRAIAIQTERKHQRIMELVSGLAHSYNLFEQLEELRRFNPTRLPGPQRMLREQDLIIGILEQITVQASVEMTPDYQMTSALPPSRMKRRAVVTEEN